MESTLKGRKKHQEMTPIKKGGKIENGKGSSIESVSVHLQYGIGSQNEYIS